MYIQTLTRYTSTCAHGHRVPTCAVHGRKYEITVCAIFIKIRYTVLPVYREELQNFPGKFHRAGMYVYMYMHVYIPLVEDFQYISVLYSLRVGIYIG